jgi:hypothetical protein
VLYAHECYLHWGGEVARYAPRLHMVENNYYNLLCLPQVLEQTKQLKHITLSVGTVSVP